RPRSAAGGSSASSGPTSPSWATTRRSNGPGPTSRSTRPPPSRAHEPQPVEQRLEVGAAERVVDPVGAGLPGDGEDGLERRGVRVVGAGGGVAHGDGVAGLLSVGPGPPVGRGAGGGVDAGPRREQAEDLDGPRRTGQDDVPPLVVRRPLVHGPSAGQLRAAVDGEEEGAAGPVGGPVPGGDEG